PYDITLPAVTWVESFIHENADIVAIHFEGVPWAEAHSGDPFHPKITEDWDRQKKATPPGGEVYVAVSPLNLGRDDLAGYRAAEEGLPIPEPLAGRSFDDPLVVAAYTKYCLRAVDALEPDYLAIGIEINELFHNGRPKWDAYVTLHQRVYEAIKREHPELPILASFTLHNMLNPEWTDREDMLAAYKDLLPYMDAVGVSFYPFMANLAGDMDRALAWLDAEFGQSGKPFVFTETGQPAETLVLESYGVTIPTDAQLQRDVLAKILTFAHDHDCDFIIWYATRDYDALWEKIRERSPEFFKAWKDCGLVDGDGVERPALDLWREHLGID
ncbi:MAG TPA: hypothetical protein QGH10_20740, partial [Armatimonadota bacterium]|nr:hypothetical protein [Armatimonadota bacterium]